MQFPKLGTTTYALSIIVLNMVNLVRENYDGELEKTFSNFTFTR